MRVLIVTGDFAGKFHNPWLLDDLAIALAETGDEVDVLVYDTKYARVRGRNPYPDKRVRLFSVGPTKIRRGPLGKLANYAAAGWGLHTWGFRLARNTGYDLCIYTSIGIFSWGLPARLRRLGIVRRSVFVLWDFFPIHQLQIGRIRSGFLHAPLRAAEALSMKNADTIAVMSPANLRFLHMYHAGLNVPTIIVPPWASDPLASSERLVPRRGRFTVLFGGQLVAGRGIETLLRAAKMLQDRPVGIDILIVGDGPARRELKELALQVGLTNTTFVSALPRVEYRRLLRSVHVGIAVTVPGVSPPTFPSKIIEYCAAAVPPVVCVEPSSDAGKMVEDAGAGLSVPAGDDLRLAAAIVTLHEEHIKGLLAARGCRARELYEAQLTVSRAAAKIRATARP